MERPRKHIICVDFDGVIHSYVSGWKGANIIADDPVPGALDWLVRMTDDEHYEEFEIAIYSSRSKEPGAIKAMQEWLIRRLTEWHIAHGDTPGVAESLAWMRVSDEGNSRIRWPTQKPAANMTIDDRAFCFRGTFPDAEWLRGFKPWNRRMGATTPHTEYGVPDAFRLTEIEDALHNTPFQDRDPADHAIGELLAELRHVRAQLNETKHSLELEKHERQKDAARFAREP